MVQSRGSEIRGGIFTKGATKTGKIQERKSIMYSEGDNRVKSIYIQNKTNQGHPNRGIPSRTLKQRMQAMVESKIAQK